VTSQLERGQDIILDIDVQGARQLRDRPELGATFIFIAPPSLAELERRLSGRRTDTPETIALRLGNAKTEIQAAGGYDYIIINDDLEQARAMLTAIILEKRAAGRRGYDGRRLDLSGIQP